MAYEGLIAAELELPNNLSAMPMEVAHDAAVSCVLADARFRTSRTDELRHIGADIVIIADACGILIRQSPHKAPSSGDDRAGSL